MSDRQHFIPGEIRFKHGAPAMNVANLRSNGRKRPEVSIAAVWDKGAIQLKGLSITKRCHDP